MNTSVFLLITLGISAISSTSGCAGDDTSTTSGPGGSGGAGASGGAGGAGATGGAGGSGGQGGGGGDSCPGEQSAIIGFMGPLPDGPLTLTITAVTPTALTGAPDAGGSELTFKWAGADLAQVFSVGDTVTYEGPIGGEETWYVFTGEAAFAAAIDHDDISSFASQEYVIPHGGPTITFDTECSDPFPCQYKGECYHAREHLLVGDAPEQVTVASNKLVTVGEYEVYNNGVFDHYVDPEATKYRSITVTGPVPPP